MPSPATRKRTGAIALGLALLLVIGAVASMFVGTPTPPQQSTPPPPVENYGIPELPDEGPLAAETPSDLDGDGEVTADEKATVKRVSDKATKVAEDLVGDELLDDATTIMITPSGQDWWDLVTSQTSYTKLWNMPVPDRVNWYALTWHQWDGKAPGGGHRMYPVVHLAFPTPQHGAAWMSNTSDAEVQLQIEFHHRGNVISLAPAGTRLSEAPLPKRLGKIADETVEAGYWSMRFGEQMLRAAEDSTLPGTYGPFWGEIGLSKLRWTAVSTHPGRWVGNAHGFDPKKVNFDGAIAILNMSMSPDGNPRGAVLGKSMHLRFGGESFGATEMTSPEAPEDADIVFSMPISTHALMTTGSDTSLGAIGYLEQWIIDGVITILPRPPLQYDDMGIDIGRGAPPGSSAP